MHCTLPFEKWKQVLREDCIACDKLREFDTLSDAVLKLLYDNMLDPSVDAIVRTGLNGPIRKPAA